MAVDALVITSAALAVVLALAEGGRSALRPPWRGSWGGPVSRLRLAQAFLVGVAIGAGAVGAAIR